MNDIAVRDDDISLNISFECLNKISSTKENYRKLQNITTSENTQNEINNLILFIFPYCG